MLAFVIFMIWLTSAAATYENDLAIRNRRAEKMAKAKQLAKRNTSKKPRSTKRKKTLQNS